MEALVGLALLLGCACTAWVLHWLTDVVPASVDEPPALPVDNEPLRDLDRGPLIADLTSDHADILLD